MSAPARRLERAPRHAPTPPARRTPRPPRHAPPSPARRTPARQTPSGVRRAAKRHHLGFAVLASAIVGSMLFAIVVLHVLLAQQSFRIDAAERRIHTLSTEHLDLLRTQATLSAPGRISTWATRHGMRLPDSIRILRAPKAASGDPAGAGTSTGATDGAAPAVAADTGTSPGR